MKHEEIEKIVRNHFWLSYARDEFIELFTDAIECIDDFDSEEDIRDVIDTHTMYTDDMWTVLRHYTDPHHASWDIAIELFYNDIMAVVRKIQREESK